MTTLSIIQKLSSTISECGTDFARKPKLLGTGLLSSKFGESLKKYGLMSTPKSPNTPSKSNPKSMTRQTTF